MLKLMLPPDAKNWLIGKDPDAGKDWRWEEKGMTEDEMVGWHHWRDGHEFEQALGDAEGQGSLVCCSPWGLKQSDVTEQLNNSKIVPPAAFMSVYKCWSIQSILKEISPEYSLEGLILKLKLQHSGHLVQRTDSLEKTLMLGKTEGRRRRGQ